MRKTTIYLPERTERRLRRAARRLGRSRAQITRAALDRYLDESERERPLPPSVGSVNDPSVQASDYEERLAEYWRKA